jgi:phosphoribosylanthranilate isomerase
MTPLAHHTWTKICGVRDLVTLEWLMPLAPDAIGLNFYAKSVRNVSPEIAREIVKTLPKSISPVGLFVNHTCDEILKICDHTGITTIQLHGDETPELMVQLQQYQLLRAVRLTPGRQLEELSAEHQRLQTAGIRPHAYLIDARSTHGYGGTGEQVSWEMLSEQYDVAQLPHLILAGGVNPANVSDALKTVRPWGIDVASGVESSPGVKDREVCCSFIEQIRRFDAGT